MGARARRLLGRVRPAPVLASQQPVPADEHAAQLDLLMAGLERETKLGIRLDAARRDIKRLTEQNAVLLQHGADALIRRLLQRMVGRADQDLCFLGPNGCQTHPAFDMDGECGYAWINSWLISPRENAGGTKVLPGVSFGLLIADNPDALPLISAALDVWLKSPDRGWDPDSSATRNRRRLAGDLQHAARANL